MKKLIVVLGILMATSICVEGHNHYNRNVSISIQTFYDELAPYGEWIYTPDYGYAWRPYLDYNEDFRPYATRGNWVYTDLGWTWISEYRWGWATFHYGRWYFDDYLGWMWIPGYEWAPAWVTWGSYNGSWAWAPMGPNIYYNVYTTWRAPIFWWTFVPYRHFCAHNWYHYTYYPTVQVNNITYINNYYTNNNHYGNDNRHNTWTWDYGPRVPDVERHGNTKVQKRTITDADTPKGIDAQANNIKVYRPEVTKKTDETRPTSYHTVEQSKTTTRTVPTYQRKTESSTKRNNEIRVTPPASNQSTRTQPTRVEPTRRETGNHSNTRNTTPPQRTNVKPPAQKPAPVRPEVSTTRTQPKAQVKPATQSQGKPQPPVKTRSK